MDGEDVEAGAEAWILQKHAENNNHPRLPGVRPLPPGFSLREAC